IYPPSAAHQQRHRTPRLLHPLPTRPSSALADCRWPRLCDGAASAPADAEPADHRGGQGRGAITHGGGDVDLSGTAAQGADGGARSEEHTSELQSRENLVCRLLLEKIKRPSS